MAQRRRDQGPSAVDAKFPFHSPTPFLKCSDKLYFLDCFLDFFFFKQNCWIWLYIMERKKKDPICGQNIVKIIYHIKVLLVQYLKKNFFSNVLEQCYVVLPQPHAKCILLGFLILRTLCQVSCLSGDQETIYSWSALIS